MSGFWEVLKLDIYKRYQGEVCMIELSCLCLKQTHFLRRHHSHIVMKSDRYGKLYMKKWMRISKINLNPPPMGKNQKV